MLHLKNGRSTTIIALGAALVAVTGLFTASTVRADGTAAPAATPAPTLTTSGLVDFYYGYQFNNPKNTTYLTPTYPSAASPFSYGSPYAVRQSSPTLALAELNITEAAAPGKISGKATLVSGDEAEVNHNALGTSSRESRFQNIQQLFATYTPSEANSPVASIDFGKFYTPFGYEVAESNANFNYTRSDVYDILPVYHTGFRITSATKSGFTGTAYVVNALINTAEEGVSSNNSSPAGIISLAYADPKSKYTVIDSFGAGTDKPTTVSQKNVLNDLDFTYNLDAKNIVGAEYTYESQEPDGVSKLTYNGYALYYHNQLNAKNAFAVRYSGYEAKQDGTDTFRPYDITGTYEIKAAAAWLTRFEYRFDGANEEAFLDSSGNTTKKNQSTVYASEVFTF